MSPSNTGRWQAVRVTSPAADASPAVRSARLSEMEPATLYRVLALRADVFVVEQQCLYLDLDGRDLEPDARELWIERGDDVVATLRVLPESDGTLRVGRVATAREARGSGLARLLVERAVELAGSADVMLDAQSHLADWYERLGFVRAGADFVEDGIPHTPMRRQAR